MLTHVGPRCLTLFLSWSTPKTHPTNQSPKIHIFLPPPPLATPLFTLAFCDQWLQSVLVSPCLTFHSSLLLIYHSIFFIISCQGVKKNLLSFFHSMTFSLFLCRPQQADTFLHIPTETQGITGLMLWSSLSISLLHLHILSHIAPEFHFTFMDKNLIKIFLVIKVSSYIYYATVYWVSKHVLQKMCVHCKKIFS